MAAFATQWGELSGCDGDCVALACIPKIFTILSLTEKACQLLGPTWLAHMAVGSRPYSQSCRPLH